MPVVATGGHSTCIPICVVEHVSCVKLAGKKFTQTTIVAFNIGIVVISHIGL